MVYILAAKKQLKYPNGYRASRELALAFGAGVPVIRANMR
jgi:hypothetical protein